MVSSRGWLAAAGRPASGSGGAVRRAWLVKEEPENYPFAQLVEEGRAEWEGVRNHVAKKHLASMKRGDLVLYYHTGKQKAVVGLARVAREAYPDPTADDPRWLAVDLVPLKPLEHAVTLQTIRQDPVFEKMPLVRQPRLSVMPVAEGELARILELARTKLEAGE
jgi:predicted RNA-binding protein with PUA-like domain